MTTSPHYLLMHWKKLTKLSRSNSRQSHVNLLNYIPLEKLFESERLISKFCNRKRGLFYTWKNITLEQNFNL